MDHWLEIFPRMVFLAVLLFAMAPAFAQTLVLKFGFEDTGATTTDSATGVALNLVSSTGGAVDLHGAAGTGVGGLGKALDLSTNTANGTGAFAYTANNAGLGLGAVNRWTVTEWVKPVTAQPNLARLLIFGTNGITDVNGNPAGSQQNIGYSVKNTKISLQDYLNNAELSSTFEQTLAPPLPVGSWTFIAHVYDGTNYYLYSASETNSVTLLATLPLSTSVNFGSSGSLFLGNRLANGRAFKGHIDDTRFYTGAANSNFLENVRLSPNSLTVAPTAFSPASPVAEGTLVTFSALVAGGTAPYAYDWQKSIDGGVTFIDLVSGNSFATYTNNTSGQGGTTNLYRLKVTDSAGTPAIVTNISAALVVISASLPPSVVADTVIAPSTAIIGDTVVMSASFSGTLPITYQWKYVTLNNLTNIISGATNSTYTILSAQLTDNGRYYLVASNNPNSGPTNVSSSAVALNVRPPSYRAVLNDPYISDAGTLFLFHLDEASGTTNTANAGTSVNQGSVAGNAIAVNETGGITNPPPSTSCLGAPGVSGFGNSAAFGPTNLLGWDYNNTGAYEGDAGGSVFSADAIPMSVLGMNGDSSPFTVECLILVTNPTLNVQQDFLSADSSSSRNMRFSIDSSGNLLFEAVVGHTFVSGPIPAGSNDPNAFAPNAWYHVAVTFDGSMARLYWTKMGSSAATAANQIASATPAVGSSTYPFSYGIQQGPLNIGGENRNGDGEYFRGRVDEVRISNVARAANEMLFRNGVTILTSPVYQTAAVGGSASFSVVASSDFPALSYQWYVGLPGLGTPVAATDAHGASYGGYNTDTLTINNIPPADNGLNFYCVATNSRPAPGPDFATSASAVLNVHTALNLSWRPIPADYTWNSVSLDWHDTDNNVDAPFTVGDNVTFGNSGGTASPITLTGTQFPASVTFNNSSASYTLAAGNGGRLSGVTGLTKTGSGTVTLLTPANEYTGVTSLSGGMVVVTNLANGSQASPIGAASSDPANLLIDGATLVYAGTNGSSDRGFTVNAGGMTFNVTNSGVTLAENGTLQGSAGGAFIKTGEGTLILSGTNNSYDGTTTVNAGTLQFGSGGANGTWGAGDITNYASLIVSRSGTVSLPNTIAGPGSFTKSGPGTLSLDGNNSYSGTTFVNNGTLVFPGLPAFGNSTNIIVTSTTGGPGGGTTVAIFGNTTVPASIALSLDSSFSGDVRSSLNSRGGPGVINSWNGPIMLNGNNAVHISSDGSTIQVGGNITGNPFTGGAIYLRGGLAVGLITGVINIPSASVLVTDGAVFTIQPPVPGTNGWLVTDILVGSIVAGTNDALPPNGAIAFGQGSSPNVLDLAGHNQRVAGLTVNSGANPSNQTIGNSSTTTNSTLTFQGPANTNTFIGSYGSVNAFRSTNSLFGGILADSVNGGAMQLALTVNGGILELTNACSYSGATTVSNGVLLVANAWGRIGTGPVTVTSGTIGGNGNIPGPVTVQPAGTFAPGLIMATNYDLLTNTTTSLTINNSLTLRGTTRVTVSTNGAFSGVTGLSEVQYGGTLVVANQDGNISPGSSFALFDAVVSSGNFSSIAGTPGPGLTWAFNPTNGVLSTIGSGVATNPTNIVATVAGNMLTLSWPLDHIGWTLKTNSVGLADSNSWFEYPPGAGSRATNRIAITFNPFATNVYFRLNYP